MLELSLRMTDPIWCLQAQPGTAAASAAGARPPQLAAPVSQIAAGPQLQRNPPAAPAPAALTKPAQVCVADCWVLRPMQPCLG